MDRLPLVVRCKQRKQLIREASALRYKLAAAHRAYFRALHSTGDALQRFVDEELATAAAVDAGDASPVLTIPSSDGKPKTSGGGGDGHLHISSSDDSHIVISGSDADSDSVGEERRRSPPVAAEMAGSPTYGYMRSSSSAVPTVVYEPPPEYYYYGGGEPVEERRPATPSPPRGEDSGWSFFNPFDFSYDESGYGYGYPRYGGGSELSSPDSGDVREKEGIPDLEDDTDTEMGKGEEVGLGRETSNSKVGSAEIGENSQSKSVSEGSGNVKSVLVEQEVEVVEEGLKRRKKSVSFEMEVSPGDSIESLHTSSLSTLSSVQSRDMREVVEEIRDQFVVASEIGKEMDSLLEVGKVGYRPKNPILKGKDMRFNSFSFFL